MPPPPVDSLQTSLDGSPFQGYAYAYPHKTAYRELVPARSLQDLWSAEDKARLFFYLHVPFCEMRCGFCNLFAVSNPEGDLVSRWLEAVLRQVGATAGVLGSRFAFARGAIGGGTPTFLTAGELERLMGGIAALLSPSLIGTPLSVEMSPATTTSEKVILLRRFGMHRASVGVQSFREDEVRSLRRNQQVREVHSALECLRRAAVPVLNVDLIYGIIGQTVASLESSLRDLAIHEPEEIYLYPLYVRPHTALGRTDGDLNENRLTLYRAGRDFLLGRGYEQVSMRLFRARRLSGPTEPTYVCQEDGMVGFGPGARSYTRSVHYSSHYATQRASVVETVAEFAACAHQDFAIARYGVLLNAEEQQRRYVIKSILRADGVNRADFHKRFGRDCLDAFPQLVELLEHKLATADEAVVRPTPAGLEWSDAIGPWLYSAEMRRRMGEFTWT